MVVKILLFETNRKWRYLWLKYIIGFDLSHHCMKCFKGGKSKHFNKTVKKKENILLSEYPAKYYYLCGVSEPYIWKENFHLAFKEVEGSTIDFDENGIHVVIENAEQITFGEEDVDWSLEHADKKEYYSCRNWQFANKIERKNTQMNLDDFF